MSLPNIAAVYASFPALFAASVFLLGLIVGSFLNVVIYRVPIMLDRNWRAHAQELLGAAESAHAQTTPAVQTQPYNLLRPRSACPACKAPIKAWQNVPVLSWLLLRGRCAACRAAIPVRYPAVELATALLSTAVAWHFGFGAAAACALVVTWALIALTGIDIDHQLLPDGITLPLLWLGLAGLGRRRPACRQLRPCGAARCDPRRGRGL